MAVSPSRCAQCSTPAPEASAAAWAVGRTPMTEGQALCADCFAKLRGRAALRWSRGLRRAA